MSITVINGGLLTSIQDLGRYGYQKYGVVVSGAMDIYSMKLANIIVGNDENEAVLEITMIGPVLKLEKGNLISITGADISPTIDGQKVPMGKPVYINEDCVLEFGKCVRGCRAYLSVAGGFDVSTVMDSKSTYLRAKLGGMDGRNLKKDDVLNINEKSELSLNIIKKIKEISTKEIFNAAKWHIKNYIKESSEAIIIRVFEDRQTTYLTKDSLADFFNSSFVIDTKSDRMGYRLDGPKIELKEKIEMISGEVSFGTIQLPPDGNPIILLADRATAGGYPKIAHVAAYDLHKLVQLKASDNIRFEKITLKEAEKLYIKREKYIEELKRSIWLLNL